MIITCTKCEKRFVVPDDAIPAEGRTVQCSACSNEWKQLPIKESESPVKAQPISVKKKRTKKRKMSAPYSKDYMKQRWGVNVQDYSQKEGLTKKPARHLPNGQVFRHKSYYHGFFISLLCTEDFYSAHSESLKEYDVTDEKHYDRTHMPKWF